MNQRSYTSVENPPDDRYNKQAVKNVILLFKLFFIH